MNIPTKRYLDILWGYKDKAIICRVQNKDELDQLQSEKNESLFHLEFSTDSSLVTVWRANEWAIDIRKHIEAKAASEKRMRQVDADKECIAYLTRLITNMLGDIAGGKMARDLAEDILRNKKTQSACFFGADKERLSWLQDL